MKKTVILTLFLCLSSLNLFAYFSNEACYRQCNSDANQMGLQCQKMRQMCSRFGAPDSTNYEMCMDDVALCLQNGKAIYESCYLACDSSTDENK